MKKIGLLIVPFLISSCSFSYAPNLYPNEAPNVSKLNEDITPTYLEVDSSNAKVCYELNEPFDPTGLVVFEHYSDGSRLVCTDYTVNDVDTSTTGSKDVIIRKDKLFAETMPIRVFENGFDFCEFANFYTRHFGYKRFVYYIGETFDRNGFELFEKIDDFSSTQVIDYDLSFPDNTKVGLGEIVITYKDFEYRRDIVIMEKPDNVPGIFYSLNSNSRLIVFTNNIHQDKYKDNDCTVSEGYYLLVNEDESLRLFDFKYMLLQPLNASYFGSSDKSVVQRLLPGGDLLVSIDGEDFILDSSIWHHTTIGW